MFAYGSLIWRPGFDYSARVKASLPGWARRFWQASTDHRGVPDAPGRVVTLVPEAGAICAGVAYLIEHPIEQTLAYLDHREQGGYQRQLIEIELLEVLADNSGSSRVTALVYVADQDNPLFIGSTPLAPLIQTISTAAGPSGTNRDYLILLGDALAQEQIDDPHINSLVNSLTEQLLS